MILDLFGPSRSAVISECGRYRYRLDRSWDPAKPRVAWIMLNPSTADGTEDDPTLRRVIGYSQAWGFGSLVVVNLFAWRATDPIDLPTNGQSVGPENDVYIGDALRESARVIVGWGGSIPRVLRDRTRDVLARIRTAGHEPYALGITRNGDPRHPLYLRRDATPQIFTPNQADRSGGPPRIV